MASKRLVYTDPATGMVHVVMPAPEWSGTLQELAEKVIPAGVTWQEVEINELPLDAQQFQQRQRTYRNAWALAGGEVVVDMPAARVIHAANVQRITAELGTTVDVAAAIAAAETPAGLYAVWPAEIERRG